MATESTAIVNLVDLVKNQKPLPKDTGDDLLFGGGARFDPLAMDVPPPPVVVPQPFVRQPAYAIENTLEKTIRVPREADPGTVRKFIPVVGLFVVAMVLLSIYLAKGDKKAPKAMVVHAPVVHAPVVTPPPVPPPAAAVPVVTPIAQPTVEAIEQPQPTVPTVPEPTVPAVDEPSAAEPAIAVADAPAPAAAPMKKKASKHSHHRAAKRAHRVTRVATAETPKPATLEKLGGKGALVVASSPSREVWVDGRSTKHMTPQRVMLAPGTHNVTLFDKKTRSAKTFQVDIKANQTLRVSKSY